MIALRKPRTAAIVLVVLASVSSAAACGNRVSHASVVAVAEGRAPGGATSTGLVSGATTVQQPTAGAAPTGAVAAPSLTSSTAPGVVAPTGGGAPIGGATSAVVTPTGPAVTGGPHQSAQPTAAVGKQDTTPVMICQVGHFTGIAGPPQGPAQPGLASWVRWTNAHGGLAGHPIQLDSKDDAIDPNKTEQIVQNCVENEHAVAIVAAFVPATVDSIAPYLDQHKVPVIGGDGITHTWFSNPDFFPEGSSNRGTAEGQVDIIIKAGNTQAAIIYCTENVGCTVGKDEVTKAAQRRGLTIKGVYQVSLASPTFTSQCSSMQSAGVKAVYTALDGSSISRLARDCNAIGYHPLYVAGGLAFDAQVVAQDPNLNGITITTSVFPWMLASTPAEQAFQTAMATYAPDQPPTESAAKAWVSGQELMQAITNVGAEAHTGPITSAMILKGLAMIHNEALGGLVVGHLNFHANAAVTEDLCWGVAALQNGKWIAPQGNKADCVS